METYLNNIDTVKVDKLLNETGINVRYFNNACQDVVKKYSEALDSLMKDIYIDCIKNQDTTLDRLEAYYLELINMIYFMQDKVEELGVFADMSESASKEVYSKSVMNQSVVKDSTGKSKITSTVMQAQANIDSQYESVVASIYDHAYKIVKNKVDVANDQCNCLRKIISSRMTEMQLSLYGPKDARTREGSED